MTRELITTDASVGPGKTVAQIVLTSVRAFEKSAGSVEAIMKHTAHIPHTALIVGLSLISVFVAQQPAVGKNKDKASTLDRATAHALTVRVTPVFAIEGSPVQATVRVAPSSENRMLRISVESENYYRSSDMQLDGENAAITHYLPLNALPAGEYAFLAVIYGPNGERARSFEEFRLLPRSQ